MYKNRTHTHTHTHTHTEQINQPPLKGIRTTDPQFEYPSAISTALNIVDDYCNNWHLCIDVSKTKVVIFSKRNTMSNIEFMLQGVRLEIVDDYSYLGICFKYKVIFDKAKQHLVDQAQKALLSIYQTIRNNLIIYN